MDLDALAGIIAYRHTGDAVTTVTAAVDRITIEHPLMEICDLELSGQVTYATGRSSMEISLQVAKAPAEDGAKVQPEDVLITCAFTMVSLDPATKAYVHHLVLVFVPWSGIVSRVGLLTVCVAPWPLRRLCWRHPRKTGCSRRARKTTRPKRLCGLEVSSKKLPVTKRVT